MRLNFLSVRYTFASPQHGGGHHEIERAGVRVRVRGVVDEDSLRTVLAALRASRVWSARPPTPACGWCSASATRARASAEDVGAPPADE